MAAPAKRLQFSYLLMGLSLLLLAGFLGAWLQRSYQDERRALQKQADELLFETVRSIEDEFVHEVFFRPILEAQNPDSPLTFNFNIDLRTPTRYEKRITLLKTEERRLDAPVDSSLMRFYLHSERQIEGQEREGAVSIVLGWKGSIDSLDGAGGDTPLHRTDWVGVGAALEKKLKERAQTQTLPFAYELVALPDSGALSGLFSAPYFDLGSEKKYALRLEGYRGYLLRRLLPEFFFSGLLFCSVGFAFFSVHRNLEEQRRLARLRSDFVSNVTHELKTPITTVGVAIEALEDFQGLEDPARTREYLEICRLELQRLSILVDRVLKMSLYEEKGLELKVETLDAGALVRSILRSMKLQFERYGAQVAFEEAPRGACRVQGDRLHLTSVLYNLLDNALKYGGDNPRIGVRVRGRDGFVELLVEDGGPGIPPEFRGRVFEKFFRVPRGNAHNVKGHGLGLSYVAEVVRRHEGVIRLENSALGGCCFRVRLPAAPEHTT